MTPKEYLATQAKILQLGKDAEALDLEEFLKRISIAEATGPIVDPTLYMYASDNLLAVKELAESIQKVSDATKNLRRALLKTSIAVMTGMQREVHPTDHDPQGSEA